MFYYLLFSIYDLLYLRFAIYDRLLTMNYYYYEILYRTCHINCLVCVGGLSEPMPEDEDKLLSAVLIFVCFIFFGTFFIGLVWSFIKVFNRHPWGNLAIVVAVWRVLPRTMGS